jgi:hypothetical protein
VALRNQDLAEISRKIFAIWVWALTVPNGRGSACESGRSTSPPFRFCYTSFQSPKAQQYNENHIFFQSITQLQYPPNTSPNPSISHLIPVQGLALQTKHQVNPQFITHRTRYTPAIRYNSTSIKTRSRSRIKQSRSNDK